MGVREDGVRFAAKQEILLSIKSRTALKTTQMPIQLVPGAVFLGESGRGVKLTTHLHLVLRIRIVERYLHAHMCLHGVVLN
jgi:hypothetical protein